MSGGPRSARQGADGAAAFSKPFIFFSLLRRSSWAQQAKELAAQQAVATKAGDKLRAAISAKEGALDEAQKDVEVAKLEAERHLAERVTLDLEVRLAYSLPLRAGGGCH